MTFIPARARVETDLPVEGLIPLAEREGNRKKPIYQIHKWWARRLGSNFRMLLLSSLLPARTTDRQLWREFYKSHRRKKLVVVDPFMGGGTSIVEATKIGARTIGNDIDPVAWFVTKKEVESADLDVLKREFRAVERDVAAELKAFYRHTRPDGSPTDVTTYFWVVVLKCGRCRKNVEAHPHYQLFIDRRQARQAVFCRHCHEVHWLSASRRQFRCNRCAGQTVISAGPSNQGVVTCACGHRSRLSDRVIARRRLETRLFALEYESPDGNERDFARATGRDRALYKAAATALGKRRARRRLVAIPTAERYDNRPISYGFATYQDLFNARQLLCLESLYRRLLKVRPRPIREYLLLAFSDALASNNMLCAYAFGYRKLTPLFGMHAYRFVTRPVEGNVWGSRFGRGSFLKCFEKLIRGKEYCLAPFEFGRGDREKVSTHERISARTTVKASEWYAEKAQALLLNTDSSRLFSVRQGSADLILTDPPYYNNLPYSELSDFYYAWLRKVLPHRRHRWSGTHTPHRESLFVRRRTPKDHQEFAAGMAKVFSECRRVLKSNGLMVFTYHHNDRRAWIALGEALLKARFRITKVLPLLAEGRSGFHSEGGNIKWDAVIVCRPNHARGVAGTSVPDEAGLLAFAKAGLKDWRARLDGTTQKLSRADRASLAFAFGLWGLSRDGSDPAYVMPAMTAIASRVNRQKVPLWLFKAAAR